MDGAGTAAHVLRLADGRALGYSVYGDLAGAPLLLLHGTPGAHSQVAIGDAAARGAGLAIVAPDRWGYGRSDMPASPSLALFAADMAALMDELGHARFAIGGISGGGPYAVATAGHLPQRATALALISPVGPIDTPTVRPCLSPFHRFCFTILPHHPWLVRAVFGGFRASLRRSPRLAARLATLRSDARDRALIDDPCIAGWLLGSFSEGLRRGLDGPVQDLATFLRPWGVDFGTIACPARLWIGRRDTAVPVAAALHLAQVIGGCTLTEMPNEGHLWVAAHFTEVLEWIAAANLAADGSGSISASASGG